MKLGFIGMGNMAQAIAIGLISHDMIKGADVYAYAPNQEKLKKNSEKIGFNPCSGLKELVSSADTIVMACKPYQIDDVLSVIKDDLKGKTLLSIAAGDWQFAKYSSILDPSVRIQHIMPNTPVMVAEGVLIFEQENSLDPEDRKAIMNMFDSVGEVVELPTRLLNIGTSITGCGPAFMDLVLEALSDAAVTYGIPRAQSYDLAAAMMKGSAQLYLETKTHPGALKDAVCSPAGTTILGVNALERSGMRAAFLNAVEATLRK